MRNIILILSIFTNVFIIKSQCDYTNSMPSIVGSSENVCFTEDVTITNSPIQNQGTITINDGVTVTFTGASFTNYWASVGKIKLMGCDAKIVFSGSFSGSFGNVDIERYCNDCSNVNNLTSSSVDLGYFKTTGSSSFVDVQCQVVLPVELISFDVKKKDNYIEVNWITGTEINNSHFEILVSNNGTDWESIKTVEGMGNTYDLTYYYETVQTNKTYFKLKQVDYDGTTSYSNIKYVSTDKQPIFNSTLNYIYISNLHGDIVGFYNIGGQLVHSVNYDGTSVVIKKSNLNTGFYIVRIGELSKKVYIYPN